MTDAAWITTVARKGTTVANIENYLYSYAAVCDVVEQDTRVIFLVRVEGDRAYAFAEGQADRLSSGLYGSRAHRSYIDARLHARDSFGASLVALGNSLPSSRTPVEDDEDLETCSLCTAEVPDACLVETDAGRICPGCDDEN